MEAAERSFWVWLSIFVVVLGTAPFAYWQGYHPLGIICGIAGLGGLFMLIRDHLSATASKLPIKVSLEVFAVVALSLIVSQLIGHEIAGKRATGELSPLQWWLYGLTLLLFAVVVSATLSKRNPARTKLNNEDGESDPNLILVADASRDFSADSNPSGSWAYGYYRGGLEGDFFPHLGRKPNLFRGVNAWESNAIDVSLSVMHHRSRQWIEGSASTYAIPPDTVCMHPGEKGTYVVVRWTCWQAGLYRIWYEFRGLDAQTSHADSDIDVRHNLRSLCEDGKLPDEHNLNGIGSRISHMSEVLDLRVKDTIDFVVGWGQGGSYGSDSTGLKAKIYQSKTGI